MWRSQAGQAAAHARQPLKDANDQASLHAALARVCRRTVWPAVMSIPGPGFSLADGWDLSGLTLSELWLRYLGIGGTASPARVAAYARGQLRPDSHQHNMIAQAINEHFHDLGEDHPVSYQNIPLLP